MTDSPSLKYGSKSWEDDASFIETDCFNKTLKHTDLMKTSAFVDWRKYSSNLEVDPATMLKRVLG